MRFPSASDVPHGPPTERQLRELRALYDISQSICTSPELDRVLQLAIQRAVALLEVEGSSVILLDEKRRELYFQVADDTRAGVEGRLREVRFPADRGIAGWVVSKGISILVPDVDRDPRHYRGVDVQTGAKTKSLLCVPLRTRGRTIGVLEAINKHHGSFVPEDLRFLEAFSNPLALAIENTQLVQALQVTQGRGSAENHPPQQKPGPMLRFETLIGESPKMQEVYRLIEPILQTAVTVLITGESGTGKELVARVIHLRGPRARGPFIAVNCAAIPEALLEAELFGYEPGAFTGATRRKPGRFELARGGTLFLDEIGEMSPTLQVKLLRVLQAKTFEPLGGTQSIETDVRILAATNRDLQQLIAAGKFREDLFYRLHVYPIAMPSLRERTEDLLPLAHHFLHTYSHEFRKEVNGLDREAGELLLRYEWPGNVRELENVLTRAVLLCPGTVVTAQDLPPALREQQPGPSWRGEAFRLPPGGISLAGLEKQLIRDALEQTHYNKSQVSRLLGLSRTQLRTRMRHYRLNRT